ncbi:MAG: LuxR C-terminal-related transcriptional regulator [Adlercreutzia equolifaciens]
MGLAVQGTGEPLSIFGLILMSAGGTVLLFCWLAAVCAQRDIGIVELMIEVEVLASAAAILLASVCVMVPSPRRHERGSLCGGTLPHSAPRAFLIGGRAVFTLEPSSLAKILCSFFVIGLVVGSLQYSVFLQQAEGEMFPVIITAISLALVLWLFNRGRDFNLPVWTKVVATLSLVALILVLFSSTLTYLAYVLAGIAYSLLECGALYMGLLLGRLYPGTRVRILATAWCVGTLGSLPLLASAFFGPHIASRVAMLFMALLLVVASIWILEDRTMSLLLSASGGAKLTSLSGRLLESFSDSRGLTTRERDVFNLYIVGRSAPYIAEKLVISESTVKSHLQHIYTKCGVHSRQELISLVETTSKE